MDEKWTRVGVILTKDFANNVLEVKRVSDRVITTAGSREWDVECLAYEYVYDMLDTEEGKVNLWVGKA